jgi:GNAT superfamily N-acetyltransferase
MPDLLVKLYELPDVAAKLDALGREGVRVRRAMAYERAPVVRWVLERFGEGWAGECEVSFSRQPIACHVATRGGHLLGFACHDATALGLFGPTGVDENERGRGLGAALLLVSLHAMAHRGYAYAVIGGAGSLGFYERVCGATEIAGTTPGLYTDRLVP